MDYMNIAIEESLKAYKKEEVPVGAIIVKNDKVIAKSHNNRISRFDVTSHAEIEAIRKASKKLKDWRLFNCDLYVTLKPCDMCMEVIRESRIRNVYYLISKSDEKHKFSKTNICTLNDVDKQDEYKQILSDFFNTKCNR